MKRRTLFQTILVMALMLLLAASFSQAQESDSDTFQPHAVGSALGTSFTYQGQLVYNDAPVNDSCDFTFSLWDGTGTGSTQIGYDVPLTAVSVSDGLFTVSLDFGSDAFSGAARWLEIEVNCGEGVITLDPRQPLTPAPYALYAPPPNTLVAADGDPVDAVYVDNNGDVGIGTTSPGERLTVAGKVESTSEGFKFPDGTTQTTAATGGAGDIKQLIQDFVVASGESVTTGDVVQFFDGYARQDSVYGSEYEFISAEIRYISAIALSDTQFVVAYRDTDDSGYGKAIVGNVSGTTISYGSEYVFNAAGTEYISAAALSPSRFVVAYKDEGNSSYGTAMVGDVSGTTITYGSEHVFNYAETLYISVAALSSTKFVVAYSDNGNSDHGTAIVGDVSGVTIAYGSEYVFNNAQPISTSVAALSDTKLVVAYGCWDGDLRYTAAVIGDVSGDSISYGSEYMLNAADSFHPSVAVLSSTKFVVAYYDNTYGSEYGTAVIGDVSGTTITYGSNHVLSSNTFYGISVAALPDAKFVVAYSYGSPHYGKAVIGSVGNTVGIARESKTGGQTVPVIIDGVSDVHSGLTPGAIYYSEITGGLTTSKTDRPIGLAVSDTELLLDIDLYEY